MMDVIAVKAGLEHCQEGKCSNCPYKVCDECTADMARDTLAVIEQQQETIKKLEANQVQHGRWVHRAERYGNILRCQILCSRCGTYKLKSAQQAVNYAMNEQEQLDMLREKSEREFGGIMPDWCEMCGAKMDGGAQV